MKHLLGYGAVCTRTGKKVQMKLRRASIAVLHGALNVERLESHRGAKLSCPSILDVNLAMQILTKMG